MDDSSDQKASSEGEGDNLSDNLSKDYEPRPELDHYEQDGIDDMDQSIINAEQRRQAERQNDLHRRQMERGRTRQPDAIFNGSEDGEMSETNAQTYHMRRQMQMQDEDDDAFHDLNNVNDYAEQKENLPAWLQKEDV
jgi:hypothetical protein